MRAGAPCSLEAPALNRVRPLLPGLWPVALVTAVAWFVGGSLPLLGPPVVAIVLGVLASVHVRDGRRTPGLRFASRRLLQSAVVLLGLPLSLREVGRVGLESLPVLAVSVVAVTATAVLLLRWLRLPSVVGTLIAVGTMVCGASAIAAASGVLEPDEDELTYAVSTVFAYNIAAVLTFPTVGHLLGMSQHGFGMWAGTAINDTSSVVAAATIYGAGATSYAVVVKLARVLLIVPVTVALSVHAQRAGRRDAGGDAAAADIRLHALVPLFVVGFLIAVLANTAGLVPDGADAGIRSAAALLTTAALAAVGMSTDVAALRTTGPRPFLFGGALWVVVACACLLAQLATGQL